MLSDCDRARALFAMSQESPNPRRSAWIVLSMLGMVAVPAAITLHTVRVPAIAKVPSANPTPYGYTCSLLLFVIPIVVIAGWFLPKETVRISKRAFWRTIAILVPIGFALDFFFAHRFFVFPNAGATLGIGAPAIGGSVPLEEYVFYFTGFLAILLIYVWSGEYWLAAYKVADYSVFTNTGQQARGAAPPDGKAASSVVSADTSFVKTVDPGEAGQVRRLLKFHPTSLVVGAALIGAAILYKKLRSPFPCGFPGYFTVLVVGGVIPSVSFFPVARRFIHWRALSLTIFMVLLISMLWEATLAVPYGWWGYQQKEMMGLFIGAWTGLPIEAVTVWIAVTYGSAIVYEIVKIWQASGKPARHAFLGEPRPQKKQ
jgi:hypothetical protein